MFSSPISTLIFLILTITLPLFIHADTSFNSKMSSDTAALFLSPSEDDSGSIELPIRRQQRSGLSQHRPILDLVIGVLDTFHSSTKSELRRIQSRHARHQDQAQYYEMMPNTTTTITPAQSTGTVKAAKTVPTARKRLIAAKYTEAKNN